MDIIDKIKKLAGGAADTVLQKYSSERIGAEAARRGLFEGYLRSVPSCTFVDLLRERQAMFQCYTDDELKYGFAARGLRDFASREAGHANACKVHLEARDDEAARVKALAAEIIERAEKL